MPASRAAYVTTESKSRAERVGGKLIVKAIAVGHGSGAMMRILNFDKTRSDVLEHEQAAEGAPAKVLRAPPEPGPPPVQEPPKEPEDPHAPLQDPDPDPIRPAQI